MFSSNLQDETDNECCKQFCQNGCKMLIHSLDVFDRHSVVCNGDTPEEAIFCKICSIYVFPDEYKMHGIMSHQKFDDLPIGYKRRQNLKSVNIRRSCTPRKTSDCFKIKNENIETLWPNYQMANRKCVFMPSSAPREHLQADQQSTSSIYKNNFNWYKDSLMPYQVHSQNFRSPMNTFRSSRDDNYSRTKDEMWSNRIKTTNSIKLQSNSASKDCLLRTKNLDNIDKNSYGNYLKSRQLSTERTEMPSTSSSMFSSSRTYSMPKGNLEQSTVNQHNDRLTCISNKNNSTIKSEYKPYHRHESELFQNAAHSTNFMEHSAEDIGIKRKKEFIAMERKKLELQERELFFEERVKEVTERENRLNHEEHELNQREHQLNMREEQLMLLKEKYTKIFDDLNPGRSFSDDFNCTGDQSDKQELGSNYLSQTHPTSGDILYDNEFFSDDNKSVILDEGNSYELITNKIQTNNRSQYDQFQLDSSKIKKTYSRSKSLSSSDGNESFKSKHNSRTLTPDINYRFKNTNLSPSISIDKNAILNKTSHSQRQYNRDSYMQYCVKNMTRIGPNDNLDYADSTLGEKKFEDCTNTNSRPAIEKSTCGKLDDRKRDMLSLCPDISLAENDNLHCLSPNNYNTETIFNENELTVKSRSNQPDDYYMNEETEDIDENIQSDLEECEENSVTILPKSSFLCPVNDYELLNDKELLIDKKNSETYGDIFFPVATPHRLEIGSDRSESGDINMIPYNKDVCPKCINTTQTSDITSQSCHNDYSLNKPLQKNRRKRGRPRKSDAIGDVRSPKRNYSPTRSVPVMVNNSPLSSNTSNHLNLLNKQNFMTSNEDANSVSTVFTPMHSIHESVQDSVSSQVLERPLRKYVGHRKTDDFSVTDGNNSIFQKNSLQSMDHVVESYRGNNLHVIKEISSSHGNEIVTTKQNSNYENISKDIIYCDRETNCESSLKVVNDFRTTLSIQDNIDSRNGEDDNSYKCNLDVQQTNLIADKANIHDILSSGKTPHAIVSSTSVGRPRRKCVRKRESVSENLCSDTISTGIPYSYKNVLIKKQENKFSFNEISETKITECNEQNRELSIAECDHNESDPNKWEKPSEIYLVEDRENWDTEKLTNNIDKELHITNPLDRKTSFNNEFDYIIPTIKEVQTDETTFLVRNTDNLSTMPVDFTLSDSFVKSKRSESRKRGRPIKSGGISKNYSLRRNSYATMSLAEPSSLPNRKKRGRPRKASTGDFMSETNNDHSDLPLKFHKKRGRSRKIPICDFIADNSNDDSHLPLTPSKKCEQSLNAHSEILISETTNDESDLKLKPHSVFEEHLKGISNDNRQTPLKRRKRYKYGKKLSSKPVPTQCGQCEQVLSSSRDFYKHALKQHDGLARPLGESQLFQDDRERLYLLREALKQNKKLICIKCKKACKSFLGYDIHIKMCGKTELEKYEKCIDCNESVRISNMPKHRSDHRKPVFEYEVLDELGGENMERPRRKTSSEPFNNDILTVTDSDDCHLDKKLYSTVNRRISMGDDHPIIAKFLSTPNSTISELLKKIAEGNVIHCPHECCLENFRSAKYFKRHIRICKYATFCYLCTACKFTCANRKIVTDHSTTHCTIEKMKKYSIEYPLNNINYGTHTMGFCHEYRKENYSTYLFPEIMCKIQEWKFVCRSQIDITTPNTHTSIPFRFDSSEFHGQWVNLPARCSLSSINNCTIFAGGEILASAWCPLSGTVTQYLALSCTSEFVDERNDICNNNVNSIQIWAMSVKDSVVDAEMMFAFRSNRGSMLSLKWCPSGGYQVDDDERLGILAAACSDGSVCIYAIPHPHQIVCKNAFFDKQPDLLLIPFDFSPFEFVCKKIDWFLGKGHEYIAACYSNGFVSIWDLLSKSEPWRVIDADGINVLRSSIWFRAHFFPCTTISFCPNTKGKHILTAALDRSTRIWDLDYLEHPLSDFRKGITTDSIWLPYWSGIIIGFDETAGVSSAGTIFKETDFFGGHTVSVLLAEGSVWSLTASHWYNVIIQGSENGVSLSINHKSSLGAENCKAINKSKFSVFETSIEEVSTKEEETTEKSFGICFYDNGLKAPAKIPRAESEGDKQVLIDTLRICTNMCWNNNYGSHNWLFVGNKAGLGRFINMSRPNIHIS